MRKISFPFPIPSALLMLLVLSGNLASAKTFNNDFETGDLTDWEADGEAFDFQPTWGDNPTARNRGQPSDSRGRNIPWEQVLTVDARGKLAATWAQMKKYY